MNNLKNLIDDYPDFPSKGIIFRDLLTILRDPIIFKELINQMSLSQSIIDADALIAIDARGFIFGTAIALNTSKPLICARKPGKLPGKLITKEYNLEYGSNSLSIQENALQPYSNFAIIDDLLATGGTANCVSEIIKSFNKKITGLSVVIELVSLGGKNKLSFPVESILNF